VDCADANSKKKRKSRADFKQRYRKTFGTMLEEEVHFLSPIYYRAK
jgi:hypothetical protein